MFKKSVLLAFLLLASFFFIEIRAQASSPINSFTVSSPGQLPATNITVPVGTSITLNWSTTGATTCSSTGALGSFPSLPLQGPSSPLVVGVIGGPFVQNLDCGGGTPKSVSVTVVPPIISPSPSPVVAPVVISSFTVSDGVKGPAQSITVSIGTSVTLNWSTTGATTCSSTGALGSFPSLPLQGPSSPLVVGVIGGPFTQTLTCGGVSRDVFVTAISVSSGTSAVPTPPTSGSISIDSFTVKSGGKGPAQSITVSASDPVTFKLSTSGASSCSATGSFGIFDELPPGGTLTTYLSEGSYSETVVCKSGGISSAPKSVSVTVRTAAGGILPPISGSAPASTPPSSGSTGSTGISSATAPISSGTPPTSLSFTIDKTIVDSGATATLSVILPSGIDITSATLECLNNSDNKISMFYGPNIYCGPSTTNGPYNVSLNTFPAEIRLINNTSNSTITTIRLTTHSPSGTRYYPVDVTVKASAIGKEAVSYGNLEVKTTQTSINPFVTIYTCSGAVCDNVAPSPSGAPLENRPLGLTGFLGVRLPFGNYKVVVRAAGYISFESPVSITSTPTVTIVVNNLVLEPHIIKSFTVRDIADTVGVNPNSPVTIKAALWEDFNLANLAGASFECKYADTAGAGQDKNKVMMFYSTTPVCSAGSSGPYELNVNPFPAIVTFDNNTSSQVPIILKLTVRAYKADRTIESHTRTVTVKVAGGGGFNINSYRQVMDKMAIIGASESSSSLESSELIQAFQYCFVNKGYIIPFLYSEDQLRAWLGTTSGEGNPTTDAIRRFQSELGLPATGGLDLQTKLRLIKSCASAGLTSPEDLRNIVIPGSTNITWGELFNSMLKEVPGVVNEAITSVTLILETVRLNTLILLRTLGN